MHVESADIRFQCEQCGQHLVVEAAAEGLTMDCPICNTGVTVPAPPPGKDGKKPPIMASTGEPIAPFADSSAEFLREELIEASLLNGKLGADMTKAREETARLQLQLKELADEHERLYASATHAQRELKTFQTERQQLKGEATNLRQRLSAAEEASAKQTAELQQTHAELVASQHDHAAAEQLVEESRLRHEELGDQLAAETQKHSTAQTQLAEAAASLAATEGDRNRALGRVGEIETALGAAHENVGHLEQERAALQSRLDAAGAAAEVAKRVLEETETQLRDEREKLHAAEQETRELKELRERLERDVQTLRSDLKELQAGREIIEIRDQLREIIAEREQLRTRADAGDAELLAANDVAEKLRAKLEETLRARDAALDEAETLRNSKAIKDNEVLRGIVARLNADLVQRTAETARMKRAQYSLKLVYGIFGVGLLAVLAFALKVLPRFVH